MKITKLKKLFLPALLLILSLIPLLDLLHPGLPKTDDGQDHVARIANFYQSLSEGNIIPRWAQNLNWGYGHPILMFLYPFPSYMASLFHFFGFSFVDSTKLVFSLAYILSGLTMYLWLKEFLPKRAAFIGGLLYIYAPYRFIDLYIRGAIGEHVAFIFPPLIFYFLLKLSQKYTYKNFSLGALSLAGLILSHNAISLMFLPIIFLYVLYLVWQVKKRKLFIFHFSLLTILGFALSAFFWLPALLEGKYTLRDIVTEGSYFTQFATLPQLLYGPWGTGDNYFMFQVGIIHWLAFLASILILFFSFRKKNIWFLNLGFLIIFIASLFIMTENSNFIWQKITILQEFQFPWRFFSVTVFSSAVLGAIIISTISKKYLTYITITITISLLFINKDYWHAQQDLNKPENFYTSIYHGTTDTGESAPIWSVRFMEKEPKAHIEIINGKAKITEIKRTSTDHQYLVFSQQKAQLSENTLYFPGWQIYIDKKPVDIQYQDPNNRGVMTFFVEKGQHDIQVKFTETKLRLIADIISVISLFIIIGLSYAKTFSRSGNI